MQPAQLPATLEQSPELVVLAQYPDRTVIIHPDSIASDDLVVEAELQQPAGLATVFVPLFGYHLVTDNLQILCGRFHWGGVVAHRIVLRDMRVSSAEFQ
jgi:hypothetical protein